MNQEIKERINALLKKGYTKAELARNLEISRVTLHKFLTVPDFSISKTLTARVTTHLDWLEKSVGHESVEALVLFFWNQKNSDALLTQSVEVIEQVTGYQAGYHGLTFGGPSAFAMITSPGPDTLTEAEFINPDKIRSLGMMRSETLPIGPKYRVSSDHGKAKAFYDRFPHARVYLKLFRDYSFSTSETLQGIQNLATSDRFKDRIFLLESGALAGQYDYFVLVIAADEQSYLDFMTSKSGLYTLTGQRLIDSVTVSVTPQELKPLFTEGNFNLSKS
jgi:hypothetical protein